MIAISFACRCVRTAKKNSPRLLPVAIALLTGILPTLSATPPADTTQSPSTRVTVIAVDSGATAAATPIDSTTQQLDTATVSTTGMVADSARLPVKATAKVNEALHVGGASPSGTKTAKPVLPADSLATDTTRINNGSYFGAGIGWLLGDFALMQLWEAALPDSLGNFGLSASSYSIPFDSAAGADAAPVDTARLSFSVKEQPAIYTMCFPVTLSMVRVREHDRRSLSLSGAWMHKVFAATIAATGDTLARKVDYKETINIFTVALACTYGKVVRKEYLSVLDIDRTYISVALQVAPLVAGSIRRNVTAPETEGRYDSIADAISFPARRSVYGGSAGARVGLNMLKRMGATGAMEFGAFFFINGYGYFRENGERVQFTDINPENGKKNRNLYWVSNGFEISVSLLRFRKE